LFIRNSIPPCRVTFSYDVVFTIVCNIVILNHKGKNYLLPLSCILQWKKLINVLRRKKYIEIISEESGMLSIDIQWRRHVPFSLKIIWIFFGLGKGCYMYYCLLKIFQSKWLFITRKINKTRKSYIIKLCQPLLH
jgi:hypothetical protein